MGVFYIPSEILSLCYFRRGDPSHEYMKQTNTLYIGCISLGIRKKNLNTTAQRFERNQTQKEHKKHKKHKNSNRVGCPNKLSFLKQHGIQFYISLFSSFLSFSNAFPSDLQSIKDAIPFRPQSLHHCPVRRRQLARRGHKAVLRPSSRGIDAQLSSL